MIDNENVCCYWHVTVSPDCYLFSQVTDQPQELQCSSYITLFSKSPSYHRGNITSDQNCTENQDVEISSLSTLILTCLCPSSRLLACVRLSSSMWISTCFLKGDNLMLTTGGLLTPPNYVTKYNAFLLTKELHFIANLYSDQ